jgi:hypothetical protein
MRLREAAGLLLALGLCSCLLPVRTGPGLEGRVIDRETGEAVEGAVVVVRWDGRYGDELPDRETLGHAETATGPDGRFRLPRYTRGGLTVWPLFRVEARVERVIHPAYACPLPRAVGPSGRVEIRLSRAELDGDRRETCRPVRARSGEATAYMTAWRELFPDPETPEQREERQRLDRLLEARATLGFGGNCEGPVTDLALAPDGAHAAFVTRDSRGSRAHVVDLGSGEVQSSPVEDPVRRRLAWTGAGELLLWQPAGRAERTVSASIFARGRSQVVWRDETALPAALDPGAGLTPVGTSPHRPLDPADLRDEADTRWLGRTFELERRVDPESGLPRDQLRVTRPDGGRHTVALPGEACGGARFGRPHYRIDASASAGLDLRFVDGGCHVVRIDLDDGRWERLDAAHEAATCRSRRRVPPAQLAAALRGWTRDLRAALSDAGADPDAAHALEIGEDGRTRVLARDYAGLPVTLEGPEFPIDTPLRRIDVTHVAHSAHASTPPSGPPPMEALEPL